MPGGAYNPTRSRAGEVVGLLPGTQLAGAAIPLPENNPPDVPPHPATVNNTFGRHRNAWTGTTIRPRVVGVTAAYRF